MKQKGKVPPFYFILLLLAVLIIKANSLYAQADAKWYSSMLRQHAWHMKKQIEIKIDSLLKGSGT
ncbi:MAG: hypothetical protein IPJ86_17400 [Bacteroidetes bacterium]|nr:hypothetical protein [Bacteroidota bacterium]